MSRWGSFASRVRGAAWAGMATRFALGMGRAIVRKIHPTARNIVMLATVGAFGTSYAKGYLHDITHPESFDSSLDIFLRAYPDDIKIFIYVFGENIPFSGLSWCPDCVRATPIIKQVFAEADNKDKVLLIRVPVARDAYKQPTFLYRHHPMLQLKAVPQLYRINKNKEVLGTVIEEECFDAENIRKLFLIGAADPEELQ